MIILILAFFCSFFVAWAIVPGLAKYARKYGLVDLPDNKRKLHQDAIPMVGGLSLFITTLLVVPVAVYFAFTFKPFFHSLGEMLLGWIPVDFARRSLRLTAGDYRELTGLVIGSGILVIVGVLDDRFQIRGRQKLFGQIIATTVLILFGFHFNEIAIAGFHFKFKVFSVFFVYAWVLAAINSVNLLDGADGIAASIGIIMGLALTMMAVYSGLMINALITIVIAGALLGFLRYNFPPAKVYLGDTGSMLIGFLLAAIAIRCASKQGSAFAFFAPVAFLAIPFIDTTAAIIRRRLTGRSIFAVDRGHLHHSLMKQGYSPKIALLWVVSLSAMTAIGGILSFVNEQSEYALVSIGLVVLVLLSCKIFGVAEYKLVSRKAYSVAKTVLNLNQDVQQSSVHVQGSRDWQVDWDELCQFADNMKLKEITLDLNAPWLHESFHATRKNSENSEKGGGNAWKAQVPLLAGGRSFGRIEVRGAQSVDHHQVIRGLLDFIGNLENSLVDVAATNTDPGDLNGGNGGESVSSSISEQDIEAPTSL